MIFLINFEVKVIIVAVHAHKKANSLLRPFCHQRPHIKGSNDAPKLPASIGCEKDPCERSLPPRNGVNSGTPPKIENIFFPVICSF